MLSVIVIGLVVAEFTDAIVRKAKSQIQDGIFFELLEGGEVHAAAGI